MPVSVALTFPSGRFHATPWGHHVNEALPEWPPSPWRFLRALVAVWKRKLTQIPSDVIEPLLSELAKIRPSFHLPPATLGHTRHYMPLGSTDESKRTRVFDAFVSLAQDAEVVFHWPEATLPDDGRTLALLLSQLGYFGRAESWCVAKLIPDFDASRVNCFAGSTPNGHDAVRVLTTDPDTWKKWDFKDRKIVRPDPPWNLLAETADLHLERWSDPPGSKWVTYARRSDCFAPRLVSRPPSTGDVKTEFVVARYVVDVPRRPERVPHSAVTEFVVARYVVDVAEGRRPLPQVTETLPFAEEVRRQLGSEYSRVVRTRHRNVEFARDDLRLLSPIIHGKDEHGGPARSHDHAFYLPTDEDRDGRIDHVTVYAAGRFSRDDVSALDRLRSLSFGREGEAVGSDKGSGKRRTTHRLLLIGLDRKLSTDAVVFGPSRVWVSATPYIAFRHLKERGRKRDSRSFIPQEAMPDFLKHVFMEDWGQRSDLSSFPKPEIEYLSDPLAALGWRYRNLEFRRAKNQYRPDKKRAGDNGYSRALGSLMLTFSDLVTGPFSLGYACHFGMGMFRPAHIMPPDMAANHPPTGLA